MRTLFFFASTLAASALLAGVSCSSSSTPVGPMNSGRDSTANGGRDVALDATEDPGNLCPDAFFPEPMCMASKCDGGCCLGDACVPVPSYTADIVPILHARCSPCHFEGGIEDFSGPGGLNLSTYAAVDNADIAIQNRIADCNMPPLDGIKKYHVDAAAPLSQMQRVALLDWLVCGALNN